MSCYAWFDSLQRLRQSWRLLHNFYLCLRESGPRIFEVDSRRRAQEIVFLLADDSRNKFRFFAYSWLDIGDMIMRRFGISQFFYLRVATGSGSHLFGVGVA